MFSENDISLLQNATAYCKDGNKIGGVGDVYLDDQSGQPEWVAISTGLFGTKKNFAPLKGASLDGDRLNLAYGKDVVTGAPQIDEDGHLDPAEEQELYRYYDQGGVAGDRVVGDRDLDRDAGVAGVATGGRRDVDVDRGVDVDRDARRDVDLDRDRVDAGAADATAREERLRVGKESQEVGRARLRKYTTTEQQSVTVPVQKEKLVVEREPVNEVVTGGRIGDSRDSVEEITLREERPVVDKEVVETERVSVGKETVTENVQVTDEVAKEHIEVEGADDVDAGRARTDRDRPLTDRDGDGKGFIGEVKDRLDGDGNPNR